MFNPYSRIHRAETTVSPKSRHFDPNITRRDRISRDDKRKSPIGSLVEADAEERAFWRKEKGRVGYLPLNAAPFECPLGPRDTEEYMASAELVRTILLKHVVSGFVQGKAIARAFQEDLMQQEEYATGTQPTL